MSASSELVLGAQFLRLSPRVLPWQSKVAEKNMAVRAWRLSLLVWPVGWVQQTRRSRIVIGERQLQDLGSQPSFWRRLQVWPGGVSVTEQALAHRHWREIQLEYHGSQPSFWRRQMNEWMILILVFYFRSWPLSCSCDLQSWSWSWYCGSGLGHGLAPARPWPTRLWQ